MQQTGRPIDTIQNDGANSKTSTENMINDLNKGLAERWMDDDDVRPVSHDILDRLVRPDADHIVPQRLILDQFVQRNADHLNPFQLLAIRNLAQFGPRPLRFPTMEEQEERIAQEERARIESGFSPFYRDPNILLGSGVNFLSFPPQPEQQRVTHNLPVIDRVWSLAGQPNVFDDYSADE